MPESTRSTKGDRDRACLVGISYPQQAPGECEGLLAELQELVTNLGVEIAGSQVVRLREPHPRFLIGSGKASEIMEWAQASDCSCIIFDQELSPAQQRNWEAESALTVIDRHEVILDIFADRAHTREATLQVELARLEYSLPRLRHAWTHLNRQRGGGVTQRGEGEAQIELDSRLIRARITRLRRELSEVVQHRHVQRRQRERIPLPTGAIVGYTNAGKSTLLNRLTGAEVLAADQLFATLDPTTRQLWLPSGGKVLLTDTVGFIRNLPHRLVEAFKATLEEAVVADFLIHVIDGSSPQAEAQRQTTLSVLRELGAEDKPTLTVFNKMDRLAAEDRTGLFFRRQESDCYLSCHSGEGMETFLERLDQVAATPCGQVELVIPHTRYDLINRLHAAGCVKTEKPCHDGVLIVGGIPPRLLPAVAPYIAKKSLPVT